MQAQLEKLATPRRSSLIWRRFNCDGFPFLWHFHPEIELTLILKGHGQRFVGDSIETFNPGDLVLLGPNLPHTWHSRPPPPPPPPPPEIPPEVSTQASHTGRPSPESSAVVIQFPRDFAGEGLWRRPEAEPIGGLMRRAERGLVFPKNHRGVADLMRAMHDQNGWDRLTGLLEILGRLAEPPDAGRVLSGIAHALPPRRDDQRRIDTVCRLLAQRYTQPMSQAQAAAAVHLSPSSFSRFFRRMTGRTFVSYLHELRVADACRRLAESEAGVTDICFDCGFENVSNFNRVFRKLRGTSPRDYRKRLAADARPPAGSTP